MKANKDGDCQSHLEQKYGARDKKPKPIMKDSSKLLLHIDRATNVTVSMFSKKKQ